MTATETTRPAPGRRSTFGVRLRRGLVAVATGAALTTVGVQWAPAGPAPVPAQLAEVTEVLAGLTMDGQPVPCTDRPSGVRVCHGHSTLGGSDLRLRSFDGVPLEFFLTLPERPTAGPDRSYPLIVQSHGWGAPPSGPEDSQYGGPTALHWASKGYVVLQMSARGWGDSCGTVESRLTAPIACLAGYLRLDDYRFEGRDVQNAIGLLVDEGWADPARIGLTGESYGAGVSLGVATLNNRMMERDGTLVPWTSPAGTPLHIAAAAPVAGWSDLASSLAPNGLTLDSEITPVDAYSVDTIGVPKLSIMAGLFIVGLQGAYYALPGTDAEADVMRWFGATIAGDPYGKPGDGEMVRQMAQYRSPYYLLAGAHGAAPAPPAPLLISGGFTDDVFPVDEALRYYNLHRQLHPAEPISLLFYDGGHQRGNNRPIDAELIGLSARIEAFLDHYVGGVGPEPARDVTAVTQECETGVPAEVHRATTWADLHPETVEYSSLGQQTVLSTGGDPTISLAFDPIFGGHACQTTDSADQPLGVATYRLPPATGQGYTLVGAPTVTATLDVTGVDSFVAARLLDVDPKTGTQTLIARGVYRIAPGTTGERHTFQLHPNAWHFEPGHIAKLELLGADVPYLRPANVPFVVTVSNLELRLPVAASPSAQVEVDGVTAEAPATPPPAGPSSRLPATGGQAGWAALVLCVIAALAWRTRAWI